MKSPAAFREASRRRERLEKRLSRAAFRLEMAELERTWAIVSANREGWSIREIGKKVALGPTRVHQLVSSPEADFAEHALSALREAGWPSPEDPLPAQEELVADRLTEEAAMLVSCAKWLEELVAGQRPVVNLRPIEDWPDSNHAIVDHGRVIRVIGVSPPTSMNWPGPGESRTFPQMPPTPIHACPCGDCSANQK